MPTERKDPPASTASVDLRLAESEYWQRTRDAVLEHQARNASAYADYQKALQQTAQDRAAKSAAAQQQAGDATTLEQRADAARALRLRMLEIAAESQRRVSAAARALGEEQLRSWYEAADKRRDALAAYLRAVQGANAGGPVLGAFAVAGDEGPDPAAVLDPPWELGAGPAGMWGLWRAPGWGGA